MRISKLGFLASLASAVSAQEYDLLFIETLLYGEYVEAVNTLGYTANVVDEPTWRNMTTADFASYKAIIISDPNCGTLDQIQFLEDTKNVWSPAVTGNMIVIGKRPSAMIAVHRRKSGQEERPLTNCFQALIPHAIWEQVVLPS